LIQSLLNQLKRIKANILISRENQGIVIINLKPAGIVTPHRGL